MNKLQATQKSIRPLEVIRFLWTSFFCRVRFTFNSTHEPKSFVSGRSSQVTTYMEGLVWSITYIRSFAEYRQSDSRLVIFDALFGRFV